MADYQEKVVDLSAVFDRRELLGAGVPIESIYVNGAVPGAVTVKLHAGARPGIEVRDFASLELCPPETQGLFITTIGAAPGQTLSLIVGTGLAVQGGA